MTHYCRPTGFWKRLLTALRLRRPCHTACSCHLISQVPIVVRGSGDESDPYVLEL